MKTFVKFAVVSTLLTSTVALADGPKDVTKRLAAAKIVVGEMMRADDKGVPQDLLQKASCIIIVPGLKKGGFIIGAQYGKGFATCRDKGGKMLTAPANVRLEGGSVGFQIGAAETDLVLLVMNENGMHKLLESKFQIGGEATAAAGPVGRDVSARTDAQMHAEMLTYSRARGVFAGVSLQGSTLRQDLDDNKDMYGKSLENTEILSGSVAVPMMAKDFLATLRKYAN